MTLHGAPFPRPGGLEITERALRFCRFPSRSRLADIGCGRGETIRHILKNHDFHILGIDKDEALIGELLSEDESFPVMTGDALRLPFPDDGLDGLLYECSFSKMESPSGVLEEAFRVLKGGGFLIVSDFYAAREERTFSGILGRVERKEALIARMEKAGFALDFFEDFSAGLPGLWGQMVLDNGLERLRELIGVGGPLCDVRCRYGLFVGRKPEADAL